MAPKNPVYEIRCRRGGRGGDDGRGLEVEGEGGENKEEASDLPVG